MKKGFTIVELITVIVLLSLIALFTYPVVTKTIKNRNEDLYQIQIKNIKDAALSYINKNSLLKDDPVIVTVCQLKQNGFLEQDIKDPRDKSYIPDDSKVTVTPNEEGNDFIFTLGENKSNYCGVDSTTIFEYVEVGSTYTETVENISNYQIFVNNSSEEYIGNDYINTSSLGTYFIEYRSSVKTIQKYVYVIDTTAPILTYKENINGSKEIGKSLITLEASNDIFEPYEAVVNDNSSEYIEIKINGNVNTKLPGTYYINYSATDSSGNSVSETQRIKVEDTKGPIVNVNGVSGNKTSMSILIDVEATDEGSGLHPSGAYSFDNGKTYQVSNTFTVDKNQTLNIVVRDLAGNTTKKTVVIDRIIKDDNNVTFTVISGDVKNNGWFVSDVIVKIKPILNQNNFNSFSYCKTNESGCEPNQTVTNYDGVDVPITGNTDNTILCAFVERKDGSITDTVCSTSFKIDKNKPNITYEFINGTQNDGFEPWYVSDVRLEIKDDSVSGIDTITYCTTTNNSCTPNKTLPSTLVDIGAQSETNNVCAYITSKAGHQGNVYCSDKYKVDKNIPTITITAVNGSGNNVSNNDFVRDKVVLTANVTPSITPEVSGYTYTWYKNGSILQNENSKTLSITNPDNTFTVDNYSVVVTTGAGNKSNEGKITIKVDTVKPTCTIKIANESSAMGNNGWFKINPVMQLAPKDNESGIDSYDLILEPSGSTIPSYNMNNTLSLNTGFYNSYYPEIYGFVKDKVGNTGVCTYNEVIKVDTEVPECEIVYHTGSSTSWAQSKTFYLVYNGYNISGSSTPVMSTNAQNNTSPLVSFDNNTVLMATQTAYLPYTITGTVTSGAGLTGTCSLEDTTTDSVKIKAVINANGYVAGEWATSDINLICNHENIEGVAPRSGVTYQWKNSAGSVVSNGQNFSATASDTYTCVAKTGAGYSSSANIAVKFDEVTPSASITGKKASGASITSGSWSNENVILTASVNPSTTGSGYTYAWYKGSTKLSATGTTYTATTNGTYKFVVTTGSGKSAEATFVVNIDRTAPTCGLAISGVVGNNGWYRSNATINGSFSDTGGSGVSGKDVNVGSASYNGSTSYTVSSNTSETKVYCHVKDAAGNIGSDSITVKVDKTAPTCTFSVISGTTGKVTCTDTGGSGIKDSGTTWALSGTTNLAKTYTATDNAGNSTPASGTFKYDSCATGSNTCQYGCSPDVWDSCATKEYYCVCLARKCGKTTSCSPYHTDSVCSGSGYPIDCGCYTQNCSYYDCYGGWVSGSCSACYTGANTCKGGFKVE